MASVCHWCGCRYDRATLQQAFGGPAQSVTTPINNHTQHAHRPLPARPVGHEPPVPQENMPEDPYNLGSMVYGSTGYGSCGISTATLLLYIYIYIYIYIHNLLYNLFKLLADYMATCVVLQP